MEGWVSLHRKIKDHWIWQDPKKFQWWVDILLSVNHSEKKVLIGNSLIQCNRGQSIMSLQTWGNRWGVSKDTARNFLKLLQKDNMIVLESVCKSTRLTVCKYESYQSGLHDQQTITKRPPNDSQTTSERSTNTNNNANNDKKDNNVNKKVKKPKVFSPEVFSTLERIKLNFPESIIPKNESKINSWLDTIDKLNRIDKIGFDEIIEISDWARKDDFWKKVYLSVNKLRKKSKNDLMFWQEFKEKIKHQQNGKNKQANSQSRFEQQKGNNQW